MKQNRYALSTTTKPKPHRHSLGAFSEADFDGISALSVRAATTWLLELWLSATRVGLVHDLGRENLHTFPPPVETNGTRMTVRRPMAGWEYGECYPVQVTLVPARKILVS